MQFNPENLTPAQAAEWSVALKCQLQSFMAHCREILALVQQENQALTGPADYQPNAFNKRRKSLLQPIDDDILKIRTWHQKWTQIRLFAAAHAKEVSMLLADIQNVLMRVLQLDRENQQAMLRRGLVPATQLPSAAAQQPHFVAGLYQRHLQS